MQSHDEGATLPLALSPPNTQTALVKRGGAPEEPPLQR